MLLQEHPSVDGTKCFRCRESTFIYGKAGNPFRMEKQVIRVQGWDQWHTNGLPYCAGEQEVSFDRVAGLLPRCIAQIIKLL